MRAAPLLVCIVGLASCSPPATSPAPPKTADPPLKAVSLASGDWETCALRIDGSVWCWGGDAERPFSPHRVNGIQGVVELVAARANSWCAKLQDDSWWCWGWSRGQLPLKANDDTDIKHPKQATRLAEADELVMGRWHGCSRTDDGGVKCWENETHYFSSLGRTLDGVPLILLRREPVVEMTAGRIHTCALLENGNIACWGLDTWGRLGQEHGLPNDAYAVAEHGPYDAVWGGSSGYTCARNLDDKLICWGPAGCDARESPTSCHENHGFTLAQVFDIGPVVHMSSTMVDACAATASGEVYCWDAFITYGNFHPEPKEVSALFGAVSVHVGGGRGCALMNDGRVKCWSRQGGHNINDPVLIRAPFD